MDSGCEVGISPRMDCMNGELDGAKSFSAIQTLPIPVTAGSL